MDSSIINLQLQYLIYVNTLISAFFLLQDLIENDTKEALMAVIFCVLKTESGN